MTLQQLKEHIDKLLENGVDPNMFVKYRDVRGGHQEIDYSVLSNDGKTLLFAEEWY